MLPDEFYPTPPHIINKMLEGIDFTKIETVLEPSAGKGDIVEAVVSKFQTSSYRRDKENGDIDVIEIDPNLRHILKGKGYRIVHDDFLTYQSRKRYHLIVMNPPFSQGDKHLLKALEIQENGGLVVCLLNAETLRNPCTNTRKDLVRKLEEYEAEIEYIDGAFADAERKTDVEIAMVKVNIPHTSKVSVILDNLRKEQEIRREQRKEQGHLIDGDFIRGIVEQYNFEIQAGVNLISEYYAMKPNLLSSFSPEDYPGLHGPVIDLKVGDYTGGRHEESVIVNAFIKKVRYKYWKALFQSPEFTERLTTNLRDEYLGKVRELCEYDFSLFNIYQIKIDISGHMIQALEETILKLFDDLSHKYHWYDETSKNIHYYNGWKTNKSYVINKKVIIPLSVYCEWSQRLDVYRAAERLGDIEKVFNYLDGGFNNPSELRQTLESAFNKGQTKKIPLKYFQVTFYKKGTCHIEFSDLELLKKFNLYGSQRKGWLPPTYGKTRYEDMTADEKAVVDSFEGKEQYEKVMANKEYYLVETRQLLALTGGYKEAV